MRWINCISSQLQLSAAFPLISHFVTASPQGEAMRCCRSFSPALFSLQQAGGWYVKSNMVYTLFEHMVYTFCSDARVPPWDEAEGGRSPTEASSQGRREPRVPLRKVDPLKNISIFIHAEAGKLELPIVYRHTAGL